LFYHEIQVSIKDYDNDYDEIETKKKNTINSNDNNGGNCYYAGSITNLQDQRIACVSALSDRYKYK